VVGACLASAIALVCSACTGTVDPEDAAGASSPGPLRSASPAGTHVVTDGGGDCPDVTGSASAQRGPLSAGPFDATILPSSQPRQMKVWVGSKKAGVDDARLQVTAPDGKVTVVTRDGGAASSDEFGQFWPGLIPTPTAGTYIIDISVARDELCVAVEYSAPR
jgi:hypothetical protein